MSRRRQAQATQVTTPVVALDTVRYDRQQLTKAAQAGGGFECAQGIQGREISTHGICEFS